MTVAKSQAEFKRQVLLYPGEDGYFVVEVPSLRKCKHILVLDISDKVETFHRTSLLLYYHPQVPGLPLNGPTISFVTQPP